MKLILDTHTHSISSGHAYSTIQEMAEGAKNKGLKLMAVTDHAPKLPGACHIYHFWNLKVIPRIIHGVEILRGVEVNILDDQGTIDLDEDILTRLDLVIASLHDACIEPGTIEENTNALIGAMSNPYVHIIGHPGNPRYPIDIDRMVRAAKEKNVLIEVNNSSFHVRQGSKDNCTAIALKAKELGCRVVVGSDAHISYDVGKFDTVLEIFRRINMPEELVINASVEKLKNFLLEKGKKI
ncbi:phosphatase [Geosporobacter ferrireducens]|uniref:Phosphatase n=1 Tax=Geosporobacter ferrireducens TaxID=1424294 RepID=A0A1D8GML9_9FIRM|nr:phosphatase [Geosporobacter ferrireducens]AOT72168.1 phosphatase [Geosporobacter ferrireducens]MTI56057.1 phosphatase [Geosporobacter ferrireducens]